MIEVPVERLLVEVREKGCKNAARALIRHAKRHNDWDLAEELQREFSEKGWQELSRETTNLIMTLFDFYIQNDINKAMEERVQDQIRSFFQ